MISALELQTMLPRCQTLSTQVSSSSFDKTSSCYFLASSNLIETGIKINMIFFCKSTFNKTLFDTKHIQINIYINLINCTKT